MQGMSAALAGCPGGPAAEPATPQRSLFMLCFSQRLITLSVLVWGAIGGALAQTSSTQGSGNEPAGSGATTGPIRLRTNPPAGQLLVPGTNQATFTNGPQVRSPEPVPYQPGEFEIYVNRLATGVDLSKSDPSRAINLVD